MRSKRELATLKMCHALTIYVLLSVLYHALCSIRNHIMIGSYVSYYLYVSEYCASRADPDLLRSEYLQTLGKELHRDIDILWTGQYAIMMPFIHLLHYHLV